MDEIDYLSTVHLLTQHRSLEGRLKGVLETTRSFLNLDICSILFVPDSGADYHIVSGGDGEMVQDERGAYASVDPLRDTTDSNVVVFRRNKSDANQSKYEIGEIFTHKLHVKSVAGADFRLHKNLEVKLRLTRNHEQGEFNDAEIKLIEKVISAVRETICDAVRQQHQAIFNTSAQKLLTRLRIGMFILNQRLEILEKSVLADELLEKIRAYHCNENWLAGRSREQQTKLDHTVRELNNNNELFYKIVDAVATEKGEQYTMVIAKTTSQDMPFSENNFLVFIFSSPETNGEPSNLLNLWHVSPAEKKVLAAIARFDNIKKVAIELKISPNTAKAQLKSAYRKLGVGSKMMLMKRLSLLRNIEALMS